MPNDPASAPSPPPPSEPGGQDFPDGRWPRPRPPRATKPPPRKRSRNSSARGTLRRPSARGALRLTLLVPALVGLVTTALLLWLMLPAPLERALVDDIQDELRVLAPLVPDPAEMDPHTWARALPSGTDLRMTLVAEDGTVLADSERNREGLASMDNHADRPEIAAALATGEGWARRRSDTTRVEYIYAARTFRDDAGRLRVLRLARPVEALLPLRLRILAALGPAILAVLVVLVAIFRRLDHRLLQPLTRIVAGVDRMADSGLDHRLPIPEADLLRSLTQGVHRVAARASGEIEALAAERDHLLRILARMTEGILVVGSDGRVILANSAFRELFGLRGEVAGRSPLELIRQPALLHLVEGTLASGEPTVVEIEVERPVERSVALAGASLGADAGAVLVARDVTDLNRLTRMRRDFVANVSHELKTPLAAIRAYAETLADGALDDPEASARFVDRILAQCSRLQALLDDLLTLSRLESRGAVAELPMQQVALRDVILRAVELVADAAEDKGVAITLEDGGNEPGEETCSVEGHAESLERLVVNLLDNAVKYNRANGEVRVRLESAEEGCVLEVADTGIGIPGDALPRLFERFYRVDKARSRDQGGTGLGLAIVKHIAQLHGGRVEVESRYQVGSTFRVWFPDPSSEKRQAGEID